MFCKLLVGLGLCIVVCLMRRLAGCDMGHMYIGWKVRETAADKTKAPRLSDDLGASVLRSMLV